MVSRAAGGQITTVLVVDDHLVVRKGVCALLADEPDMRVVGDAADGLEAEAQALQLHPDVILMDVYMPHRDGLESLISIKNKLPEVKILLLTVSEKDADLVKALRFGADGYVLKKGDGANVTEAVRRVARGEAVLPTSVAQKLMKEILTKQGIFRLSTREKEVLELLGDGLSNVEIAGRIGCSNATVGSYVHRLLQKLHLNNRTEAINYAIQYNRPVA